MEWSEVVDHPSLRDLPFKIELDENGKVIMTPVKIKHSFYQSEISSLLNKQRADGKAMVECAIKTRKGTKVADAAWASRERLQRILPETDASIAPEVCVEVVSASNTEEEMRGKRKLYFERGAHEVWICDEHGAIAFYNAKRKLKKSILFPDFPNKVEM